MSTFGEVALLHKSCLVSVKDREGYRIDINIYLIVDLLVYI